MLVPIYKDGMEVSVSSNLKALDEQIRALKWSIEFSDTTEKDKEIHRAALQACEKQREKFLNENAIFGGKDNGKSVRSN